MPENMIIIKSDGNHASDHTMCQRTVHKYLKNLDLVKNDPKRVTNLSQALTQAFNGQGKPTEPFDHLGHKVLHASAGDGQTTSVTLFYYMDGETMMLIALGEHWGKRGASYKITGYGQPKGAYFEAGNTITLK